MQVECFQGVMYIVFLEVRRSTSIFLNGIIYFVNATRHFVDKSINTLAPENHQLSGYFNLNLSNVTHERENILRLFLILDREPSHLFLNLQQQT